MIKGIGTGEPWSPIMVNVILGLCEYNFIKRC